MKGPVKPLHKIEFSCPVALPVICLARECIRDIQDLIKDSAPINLISNIARMKARDFDL